MNEISVQGGALTVDHSHAKVKRCIQVVQPEKEVGLRSSLSSLGAKKRQHFLVKSQVLLSEFSNQSIGESWRLDDECTADVF